MGGGGVGNVFSFSCTHTDFGLGFHPGGISGRGNLKVIYYYKIYCISKVITIYPLQQVRPK